VAFITRFVIIEILLPTLEEFYMNISLTPALEKMVQDKVASGLYNSASEVIREALRLLSDRDEIQKRRIEELNREIQLGLDDVEAGRVLDGETAMNALIKRYE
jgi:antitoxin ParD1/3/4